MADRIGATEAPRCADCAATAIYRGTLHGEVAYFCDLHISPDATDFWQIQQR
ncbi:MAG: hypothetical protein M3R48_05750 [Candidatus Dormibacteraeota bacterium]|nr:hypothetical protein [Candidatus Dormibacteraeota bacterium]